MVGACDLSLYYSWLSKYSVTGDREMARRPMLGNGDFLEYGSLGFQHTNELLQEA